MSDPQTGPTETPTEKEAREMQRDSLIDIYVRLNGDQEKDYCFCLPRDSPVAVLHSIFEHMPIVLSPTFFYHKKPVGFHLDTSPGFITSEGALLFNPKGGYTVIADETKRIGDVAREGQLFIPVFKHNLLRWFTVVFVLLFWLYTDLPEWITPTPGISIFALSTRIYDYYFPEPVDPTAEPYEPPENDGVADVIFFFFHLIKVTVIFLIFFLGGYNPHSINPFHDSGDISADTLRAIGWTGARRITIEEWREENRTRRIEEVGGAVKAYEAGILLGLSSSGVYLQPGEGFNTPMDYVPPPVEPPAEELESTTVLIETTETVVTSDSETVTRTETVVEKTTEPEEIDTVDIETVLWRLGPDYEANLTRYRRAEITRRMKLGDTVAVALKEWRRIGPLVALPEVERKYALRKRLDTRPDLFKKKFQ